jgi:unsaturated rhamnogalacturonyl hydrolase
MERIPNALLPNIRFVVEAPTIELPPNKRVPFGWMAKAVDRTGCGKDTVLKPKLESSFGSELPLGAMESFISRPGAEHGLFRITVAIDVREEKKIEVILPSSGKVVGLFDIRYAYVLQIFEIPIPVCYIPEVLDYGLVLRMSQGEQPLWFFSRLSPEENEAVLLPHLLLASGDAEGKEVSFYKQLSSISSVQTFGWMEGCVLDGLYDLDEAFPYQGWREALHTHLDKFLHEEGGLIYENPRSEPVDQQIYGIEGTLPFAVIAKLWPEHPLLNLVIEFWYSRMEGGGEVIADGSITTEGAYTVSYPLAVLAKYHGRSDLAELAISNLLYRKQVLCTEAEIYWQYNNENRLYKNWARGCTWYMLGLTRSIVELRSGDQSMMPATDELEQECRRVAFLAMSYQRPDGLWACFLGEDESGVDTSGSAGIAAALAIGAKHGILSKEALEAAERTYAGLQAYLTRDGLLTGVAQSNRHGEALQRSGYRVISQMAMGLMGQLAAALGRSEATCSYTQKD